MYFYIFTFSFLHLHFFIYIFSLGYMKKCMISQEKAYQKEGQEGILC